MNLGVSKGKSELLLFTKRLIVELDLTPLESNQTLERLVLIFLGSIKTDQT